jgi:aminoglycoside 3-N-acetyltransferase
MLFVTYPKLLSYEFLRRGEIFDVRTTPSYMGVLSEFARRQKNAIRSLHPTKSVCAIGPYAKELTSSHQESPYPFDYCSPYYKLINYDAKIIGLGVSTEVLSFVHCVDDSLKEAFIVEPYHNKLFSAKCLNYDGELEIVQTLAHNMRKMNHNIPSFMKKNISSETCRDMSIHNMHFFLAKTRELLSVMIKLAQDNTTIYPKSSYKRRPS